MTETQFFFCSHLGRYMPIGACQPLRDRGKKDCFECKEYKEQIKAVLKEAADKLKEAQNER